MEKHTTMRTQDLILDSRIQHIADESFTLQTLPIGLRLCEALLQNLCLYIREILFREAGKDLLPLFRARLPQKFH